MEYISVKDFSHKYNISAHRSQLLRLWQNRYIVNCYPGNRLKSDLLRSSLLLVAAVGVALAMSGQPSVGDTIAEDDIFSHHLDLNEVVVTGSTGAVRLSDASSAVTVLRSDAMFGTSSTNAVDAVASLPGVSQVTTGGSISKPVIRGLGYNRIVVVADGVRQEGQQWGDEHGIEIDGNGINTVEVLKGPASLVYGSDALAGVIKFNAMPALAPGRQRLTASTEYQTNNGLFGYSFNWAGNSRRNFWDLRYSDKWAHCYRNRRDGRVPNSGFSERALRASGGLNRDWGHSWLTMSYFGQVPSIVEGERDETTGRLINEGKSPTAYGHGMPYQRVNHYKVVSDNQFNVGYSGKIYALLAYQLNRRREYEEPEAPDQYGLYLKLHTVNYNVYYAARETRAGLTWSAGVNGMWQRSENAGEEFLIPDYRLFDFGTFATVGKRWERWSVNAGVRWDRRHLTSDALVDDGEPRFAALRRNFNGVTASGGAVWRPATGLNVKMNVARGFRAPNISELASNGEHEGALRYEVGNGDLRPEYSVQADLGIDYSNGWLTAQVALFANLIDNYIFIERDGDRFVDENPVYRYTQGDARLLGGEASIDLHPIHSLHLSSSFAFVNATQLHQSAENRYLPFTPAPRWQCDVKWEILHGDGNRVFTNTYFAAGLDYNFKQNRYRHGTETATPGYALLSCSAGTDIKYRGRHLATVAVIVNNLTNTVYQSHLSRLKYAPLNPITGDRGVYNPGTNVTIKLSFTIL